MANTTTLPKGITTEILQDNWSKAYAAYTRAFRKMFLLDSADRNKMWEAIRAQFPAYQIMPETNHVAYIKNNLLASLYTVGKSADLLPTTEEDIGILEDINTWLNHHWGVAGVSYFQMLAGERAALTNLGITQVGWDAGLTGAGAVHGKGGPVYKNVDPAKFMRDPYAVDLDTSAYCMTWEDLHVSILKLNPNYAPVLDAVIKETEFSAEAAPIDMKLDRPTSSEALSNKDYRRLVIHWVRTDGKIYEIHTLNSAGVLYVKEIKPSLFPFAMLYCNLPSGDVIGTSECARIFANSVAYNMMNTLLLTAEYKNQRPPRFVSNGSGLNIASFIKHGNEADRTFSVNGPANQAVHYHQFPMPSPVAANIMQNLSNDIQQITGVDGRYTGKNTGSILTTGGIEAAIDQATLIDTPKILNMENYAKRLTQLTIGVMMEFAPKRKYFVKDGKTGDYKTVEIDFPKLGKDTVYQYELSVSSDLPKNKARISQMANTLMEKQMQYAQSGMKVELITPEEWLMMQDVPIREYMQKRMGIQRSKDYQEKVAEILFTFAGLVRNGANPQEAMDLTAQQFQASEDPAAMPPMMQEEAPPPTDPRQLAPQAPENLPPEDVMY